MIIFLPNAGTPRRVNAFHLTTKTNLSITDTIKFLPAGVVPWFLENGKSPALVGLRENKNCTHEVARKLIEEKKQGLKDGTFRKDVLNLLGSPPISPMKHGG